MSLPRGPEEVQGVFYANARLAFSTTGVCLWASDIPQKHYLAFMSRIVEKTTEYATSIIIDALQHPLVSG
eukprot:5481727-Prorocentrum_lima.AAC.1